MTTIDEAPLADVELAELERDPYPTLARLREEAPVAFAPALDSWLLTRFDDVKEALRDAETFSSGWGSPIDEVIGSHRVDGSSGEPHARYRRGLNGSLAPRAVEAHANAVLKPLIEERIDAVAGLGRADLIDTLLEPLSVAAFESLLGVPGLDPDMLRRWLHGLSLGASNATRDPARTAAAQAISDEIDAQLWPYFEAVDGQEGGGLVAHLLEHAAGETLAERVADVLPTIKTAIGAGEQEPGDGTATALVGILSDEANRAAFRADPAGLVGPAVEEALRWISPIQQLGRRTTRAVEIRGIAIPAGAMVSLSLASANRDRDVWGPTADRFRLDRPTGGHLGLGFGSHFCAGNYFGRTVMRHALVRLFERLPDLRLEEVTFRGMIFRKATRLVATWPV